MKFLWQCFGYKSKLPVVVVHSQDLKGLLKVKGHGDDKKTGAGKVRAGMLRAGMTRLTRATTPQLPSQIQQRQVSRVGAPSPHPCLAWWENRNVFQEGCARVWKTNILFSSRTLFTLSEKRHAHLFQNKEQNWLGSPKHLSSSIIFCWDFFVSGFTCSTSFFPFLN